MKKLCDVCNIELAENDFPNHLQGKRHLRNVKSANYQQRFLERSIYVSRMPPNLSVDNVVNFFEQFGVVERCKVRPHFAIVEFQNKDAVSLLLKQNVWMGSYKLQIGKGKWNNPGPSTPKNDADKNPQKVADELVFADLKTKLQAETTFEGELSTFLETVQQSEEKVEKDWQVIHFSLREALKPVFPRCEIYRFGSSITGLCLKGSDIDIYLDILEPINSDDSKTGWTPRTLFKEVKYYLYKRRETFDKIIPIPKAKTPIIKFCHSVTSTNCDISFKNNLGVMNSQLIKRLLCVDVRLKPLMIIIKFWAKTCELSGHGKFTNYAIVMMVIFYLQQPETNMLPSIVDLQKNFEPGYQWAWNFDTNIKFPCSENEASITELLVGFFKFYLNFPFDQKLICPSDGHAHSRADFAKVCAEKAADTDPLQLNHPICVQDPLELDCNITSGVTAKILVAFQSFCAVGVEVCERALKNKDKPFLLSLFTTLPAAQQNLASARITIFAMKTLSVGLPPDFESRNDIEDKEKFAKDNWYRLTQRFVEDTLRNVFKLEVQATKLNREAKQRKIVKTSDVHSNDSDEIELECTGTYCLIAGRKTKSSCLDPSLSPIAKEALISEELLSQQKKAGVKPANINFTCTIIREENPVRLVVQMVDRKSAKKSFRQFASFLTTKMPIIINKELLYTLQYNKPTTL